MNLSERLKTIASMIKEGSSIIDVGCDHALLDIYLTVNKNCNCIAIDNKESVLKYSKQNIDKYNMNNKIKLLLNNGLDNIDINNSDTVILAGLGTKTILEIIKGKNINNLIVQSNDDIYRLRYYLCKFGYKIVDERMIYEKKYYTIIKLKRGKSKYNKMELMYGPILLKNNDLVFKDYLDYKKVQLKQLLNKIPRKYIFRRLKVKIKLNKIKRY